MSLRSVLLVPGDRSDNFARAQASGAGAFILALEDSVTPRKKIDAKAVVADWLVTGRSARALARANSHDRGANAAELTGLRTNAPHDCRRAITPEERWRLIQVRRPFQTTTAAEAINPPFAQKTRVARSAIAKVEIIGHPLHPIVNIGT